MSPPSQTTIESVKTFRGLAASAMVLEDITKSRPYSLECLMLCIESEYLDGAPPIKLWVSIGVAMRLMLRMGYHRDSSLYSNITCFQGEMRRRVWHFVYQLDVLFSALVGLPNMIRNIQSDTELPHNLLDADFSPGITCLPESRPVSEITPTLYSIVKGRICSVFAATAEISHAVIPPKYSEVMDLDSSSQESYVIIPPALRVRPMDQSIIDPPDLIMNRFNLELLHLKTRCILHRRYLTEARMDSRFEYSRRTCVDAARRILAHHLTIYDACQPGGRLSRFRWYMSTLSTHDFLLAAMIICLELDLESKAGLDQVDNLSRQTNIHRKELIDALRAFYNVFRISENSSLKANQASKAMAIMLRKVDEAPALDTNWNIDEARYQETAAVFENSAGFGWPGDFGESTRLGDMLDTPLNLDWLRWDNYINGEEELSPELD